MRVRSATTLVALIALAGVGSGIAPGPTSAAFQGANGRIVFVRNGADSSIVTMAANGSDEQVLLTATTPDFLREPEWSPGGTMIAFTRGSDGNADIWRMDADGSGLVRLTSGPGSDTNPAWSADGARIAFSSDRSGDSEIYSMRTDGTDVARLTNRPGIDRDPAWSPDDRRIAYASQREQHLTIYSMRPDGSDVRRVSTITEDLEDHDDPAWSPDGTRIVFDRWSPDYFDAVIEVVVATGVQRRVDLQPGDSFDAAYAPDPTAPAPAAIVYAWSTYLVFESADLFVRSTAPGASFTQLTDTVDISEVQANWQPVPAFPLVDARFSSFGPEIEWLFAAKITAGCSRERFCPGDPLTRAQMASLLVRALELPASVVDVFTDDDGSTHEADIDALAAAGITAGCGGGRYCPTGIVSRAEMASFLARALDLPRTSKDAFTDDEGNTHEAEINALAASGITAGCGGSRYCPRGPVTRGQIAAFLYRALAGNH